MTIEQNPQEGNICCNWTDNTSPTIEQISAIETEWNTFVNNYYTKIEDKYPDTDLSSVNLDRGSEVQRNVDGTSVKHATTGQVMYRLFDFNEDPIYIAKEELGALRLKSLLINTTDAFITCDIEIVMGSERLPSGITCSHAEIADKTTDEIDESGNAIQVLRTGITSAIRDGKITLRTHENHYVYGDEGHVKKSIIIVP